MTVATNDHQLGNNSVVVIVRVCAVQELFEVRAAIAIGVAVRIDSDVAEVIIFPPVGQTILIRIVYDIGSEKIKTKEIFGLADISDREVIRWIGDASPRITVGVADCDEAIVEWLGQVLELAKVYRSEIVSLRVRLVPAVNKKV